MIEVQVTTGVCVDAKNRKANNEKKFSRPVGREGKLCKLRVKEENAVSMQLARYATIFTLFKEKKSLFSVALFFFCLTFNFKNLLRPLAMSIFIKTFPRSFARQLN